MAFIQNPHSEGLIRDAWPAKLARLTMDDKEFDAMAPYEYVPRSPSAIMDWAVVASIPRPLDPSRRWIILHSPDPANSTDDVYPVSLRTQGFLGKHNFKILGSWDGSERNACKAVNQLVLHGGDFPELFQPQQDVIDSLRDLVRQVTEDMSPRRSQTADSMFFQRRVFKKVVPGVTTQRSVLTAADDILGNARAIDRQWRVVDKIKFGRRLTSGRVRTCNPLEFKDGDFVDVTATIEIASIRGRSGSSTAVMHCVPTTVIRLCPAADVPEKMPGPAEASDSGEDVARDEFDGELDQTDEE
ncbi:hypothetical protein FA95DRAFT_1603329 [Auriscalpium vulgare]|uniref:Uncharacterized protein n=1 Tax=Auriscalpium vulgare TaxID=40419 RepID=A0ACB8S3G4_9AGAM|nr:hypothetical protein FA95DRAFT_1603329 [Auriscalpium vulgare]